jgi:hypothetical protein
MRLVTPGQLFSFNYTSYDQNASLFVQFKIYDVSSGTASFVSNVVASLAGFGSYMATFNPVANKTYLVIGLVYTSGSYITVDTTRSPSADVYQSAEETISFLGFNYAAYDQNASLNVQASIYKLSTGSPVLLTTASMVHVTNGVYFGSYTATIGNTYNIASVVYTSNSFLTPDLTRAPNVEEFDSFQLADEIYVLGPGVLRSNQSEFSSSLYPPIHFTQGDNAILSLTAIDGNKNPINLTGATFYSVFNGPNGSFTYSVPNSQHAINQDQVDFTGQFSLTLVPADTNSIGLGWHKEILTFVTIGSNTVCFRGPNLLQVYPPVPFE